MKTEYHLIVTTSAKALTEAVNDFLEHGWQLHFGPSMSANDAGWGFAQAVIKTILEEIP